MILGQLRTGARSTTYAALIISFQKMYGFGGLGEVEVEIWSDVTIAGQTTNKKER